MKIINSKTTIKNFAQLRTGETFRCGDKFYMKIATSLLKEDVTDYLDDYEMSSIDDFFEEYDEVNAVELASGILVGFHSMASVEVLEAELHIV